MYMLTRDLLVVANLVIARQHVQHAERDIGLLILSGCPIPVLCLNDCNTTSNLSYNLLLPSL